MFKLNIEKAKEIHRNNIRTARIKIFETKDNEFMRAVERNDTAAQRVIVEEKEKLRNATQTPEIINASSLEEIKNSWDESLLGPSPYNF